jgi:hypothetical protein
MKTNPIPFVALWKLIGHMHHEELGHYCEYMMSEPTDDHIYKSAITVLRWLRTFPEHAEDANDFLVDARVAVADAKAGNDESLVATHHKEIGVRRRLRAPSAEPALMRSKRMTPLKNRVLTLIRRAGPNGISGDDLFAIIYDGQLPCYRGGHAGRDETRQRTTLKANIHQLNKSIAANGIRVCGERCPGGHYRLVKMEPES